MFYYIYFFFDFKFNTMSNTMSDKNSVNFTRREFLGTVAAAAAFTIVPRSVLGGPGYEEFLDFDPAEVKAALEDPEKIGRASCRERV